MATEFLHWLAAVSSIPARLSGTTRAESHQGHLHLADIRNLVRSGSSGSPAAIQGASSRPFESPLAQATAYLPTTDGFDALFAALQHRAFHGELVRGVASSARTDVGGARGARIEAPRIHQQAFNRMASNLFLLNGGRRP